LARFAAEAYPFKDQLQRDRDDAQAALRSGPNETAKFNFSTGFVRDALKH
jgi:hypothetical protein